MDAEASPKPAVVAVQDDPPDPAPAASSTTSDPPEPPVPLGTPITTLIHVIDGGKRAIVGRHVEVESGHYACEPVKIIRVTGDASSTLHEAFLKTLPEGVSADKAGVVLERDPGVNEKTANQVLEQALGEYDPDVVYCMDDRINCKDIPVCLRGD